MGVVLHLLLQVLVCPADQSSDAAPHAGEGCGPARVARDSGGQRGVHDVSQQVRDGRFASGEQLAKVLVVGAPLSIDVRPPGFHER